MINEYFNNDINNPKYLFCGKSKLYEDNQLKNDSTIILTSSFIAASAYAFKDKIKKNTNGQDWKVSIEKDSKTDNVKIEIDNINIDDDIEAFIYIFKYDESCNHVKGSIHYKYQDNMNQIDILKIKFADFKKYYIINNI